MIVVLHNIRSLHNVGSIFRTADAVGCKKIYLTGITPSPLDEFGRPRQALTKVSLGAEKYLKWEKVGLSSSSKAARTAVKLIENLKKNGYRILAIEQSKNSIPYLKYKKAKINNLVLVVGNEIKGLPRAVLNRADKILEIPMKGRKESLNVAVAFGIVAFSLIN